MRVEDKGAGNCIGVEDVLYSAIPQPTKRFALVLAGTTFPHPSYRIYHNTKAQVYVFDYVRSGKGVIEYNGKIYPLRQGDFFFIKADTPCTYWSDPEDPFQKIWFNVCGSLVEVLLEQYDVKNPFFIIQHDFSPYIEAVHQLCKDKKLHDLPIDEIALIVHEMIIAMSHTKQRDHVIELHRQIRDYLFENLEKDLTIDEIANHFFISRSYLMEMFRAAYDEPVYTFFQRNKIQLACRLLQNTQLTIKQISVRLSFSDPYYFSRVFKKYAGISPQKYRNENRKDEKLQ